VADAIVRLLGSPRSEGGTFHLTAGAGKSLSVRRLFEMTIGMFGRQAAPTLCFEGQGRRVSDPRLRRLYERLQCYLDYILGGKTFDDSRYRRLVGPAAPTCPDPRAFLPRVLSFASSALSPGSG
jgi:hypothetical protein